VEGGRLNGADKVLDVLVGEPVLLEGNVAPNRLEEALPVDTLDEVVGQLVQKLGQLQAMPSRKNFFFVNSGKKYFMRSV